MHLYLLILLIEWLNYRFTISSFSSTLYSHPFNPYFFNLTIVSVISTDTNSVHRQLKGDERCTAIALAGPHSCRMTSLSRRALTLRDCCHSHRPIKESTPAVCSSWLLKKVGPWCTQQFSSVTSSAASPIDAGTVPISLLRGNLIHRYIHTYIHTYILMQIILVYGDLIHSLVNSYMIPYLHSQIHTYIHKLHTYMHEYVCLY